MILQITNTCSEWYQFHIIPQSYPHPSTTPMQMHFESIWISLNSVPEHEVQMIRQHYPSDHLSLRLVYFWTLSFVSNQLKCFIENGTVTQDTVVEYSPNISSKAGFPLYRFPIFFKISLNLWFREQTISWSKTNRTIFRRLVRKFISKKLELIWSRGMRRMKGEMSENQGTSDYFLLYHGLSNALLSHRRLSEQSGSPTVTRRRKEPSYENKLYFIVVFSIELSKIAKEWEYVRNQ